VAAANSAYPAPAYSAPAYKAPSYSGSAYETKQYVSSNGFSSITAKHFLKPGWFRISQAPQPYAFNWAVNDYYGSDYSHTESSDGSVTSGSYRVVLPDGRTQIVTYKADSYGYTADVKYEGEAKYPEYKAASYSAPAYSAPAYSAPAYSAPAYSAPASSARYTAPAVASVY
jgi:hypothetical protein